MTACFALHVGRCSPFLFITFNFFSFFLQVSNIILIFASESPEVPEAIHTPGLSFSCTYTTFIILLYTDKTPAPNRSLGQQGRPEWCHGHQR